MCGLIAFIPTTPKITTSRYIMDQYQDQYLRGQKGFGLVQITKNKILTERATEPLQALLNIRFATAPIQILHHRQPTSSPNTIKQTHPIHVSNKILKNDYLIIHNGMIHNEKTLFEKHTKLKFEYTTLKQETERTWEALSRKYEETTKNIFNDSESLAIELALYLEKNQKQIEIKGSAAFIILQINKKTKHPEKIYWGKNDSSVLETLKTPKGLLIASTIHDPNSISVKDSTIQELSLKKFFLQKNKFPTKISPLIKTTKLNFKKEDLLYDDTPSSPYSQRKAKNYKEQTSTTKPLIEPKEETLELNLLSNREKAFLKMAERLGETIQTEIDDICLDMSTENVTVDQITELGSNLIDLLIEKANLATKKLRPMFDRKEKEEEERIDKLITNNTNSMNYLSPPHESSRHRCGY